MSSAFRRYEILLPLRFNDGSAVPDDLTAGRVEDRHLALDDRDERVAPVADAEQYG